MAFLDNSGDIILDAVLTDAGRKRLARGDGTFKVTKYAFGDDEIDYSSYNPSHSSGSAYFDLEILQTPILEAFTNNRSSLKSRLISISNNNLLYLPEMLLNEENTQITKRAADNLLAKGAFLIAVDLNTKKNLSKYTTISEMYLDGSEMGDSSGKHIRVDQGLNTDKIDAVNPLTAELTEQQYMIQIDNRLGSVFDVFGSSNEPVGGSPSFIDDDQIATYYVTKGVGGYVDVCVAGDIKDVKTSPSYELIEGPRGTKLRFGILASSGLKQAQYLFETIGTTGQTDGMSSAKLYNFINSTVKVTGVTTGYSIDIPITFVRTTTEPDD
tara:strand:- start:239 stop:1216 length:978 start_codon:yes stop_codon:yes gene_type:complete